MKECSKCGIAKEPKQFHANPKAADGLDYRCRDCASAYTSARKGLRKEDPAKRTARTAKRKLEHPERIRANNILMCAIRAGEVTPLPCFECGSPKTDGHHADYDQPLSVIWLCRKHHMELHKNAGK